MMNLKWGGGRRGGVFSSLLILFKQDDTFRQVEIRSTDSSYILNRESNERV
jgi:hypothetical protein